MLEKVMLICAIREIISVRNSVLNIKNVDYNAIQKKIIETKIMNVKKLYIAKKNVVQQVVRINAKKELLMSMINCNINVIQ